MNVLRQLLRLVVVVLTLSVVIFVLVGGLWYTSQSARGQAPEVGYTITVSKLERAALALYLYRFRAEDVSLPVDSQSTREVTFVVNPGEGVGLVAYHLWEQNLVQDADLFRRVVQYMGADRDIQAGIYALRPRMTMEEITRVLQHGELPWVLVTIPEGWRIEEIASRLAVRYGENNDRYIIANARDFVQAAQLGRIDYDFLRDRPEGTPTSLEGFLFPDTYKFPEQTNPNAIIDIMLQNWDRRVPTRLRDKATERGMTMYEVVALASIVEREAVHDEERPLIAGVYLNRLATGMYLQSDPSVQYAKGYSEATKRWWNPMIQEEAITVGSPYNTFLNPGLPPGPICNPGYASIEAVLAPQESDYLFFYSRGDGYHAFAVTYEEHLRNEEIYSKSR